MISSERRASEAYAGTACLCGNWKANHSYLCRDHYYELGDEVRRKLHSMSLVDAYSTIEDELGLRWPAEGDLN